MTSFSPTEGFGLVRTERRVKKRLAAVAPVSYSIPAIGYAIPLQSSSLHTVRGLLLPALSRDAFTGTANHF
jgi:hypothetical protein